jgi:pimeloyl-ACP methyl ester carboxylesterase
MVPQPVGFSLAADFAVGSVGRARLHCRLRSGAVAHKLRRMTRFVLVHGAWHGAWCWQRLKTELEAAGHSVVAPDLPSLGEDQTPPEKITLEYWARFVADFVSTPPGPVILVGHSRGGIVISQAAEFAPENIARLVYIAGWLVPNGQSLAGITEGMTDSLVVPNMEPARRGVTCRVRDSVLREAFYGACSDADFAFARERLRPEPLKPLVTPLKLTERFAKLPRAYVECTFDRAVPLAAQRRMREALPCDRVLTLDTDHSPFFSKTTELAQWLGGL